MPVSLVHEYLMHAVYFAPRGKKRLLELGNNIAQRYLSPMDRLIGLVGDGGAGKSLLIRGMFPGLELTNDEDGINVRPLPVLDDAGRGNFRSRTYHMDARFEAAFVGPWELAEAVRKAIALDHRVVVEHFELLYPHLGINAQMLIGVGEEVIVTRPDIFGPEPREICEIVFESLIYRKMAHSAEDLTVLALSEMGVGEPGTYGDIKRGFVMEFESEPEVDLEEVERRVQCYIREDRPICYHDEEHIIIGRNLLHCTGPRLHVRRTDEIDNFRLIKEFKWNPMRNFYSLVGLVGPQVEEGVLLHDRFQLLKEKKPR